MKMKKYIIHDTLEAYIKEGDKEYFFGLTTGGNISRAVTQEQLRAGIHNKIFAVLSVDDGMTFSVTTGLHYRDVYELQTGQKFEPSTELTVHEVKELPDGTLEVNEKTTLAGDVLEFKSSSLPRIVDAQLKTIAYDKDTNKVVADIYYVFPKSQPDGNLNEDFNAGTNQTQEINFTVLADENDSYGKIMIIPRDQSDAGV